MMSTKRRKRHTPEQIVLKLRDADAMLNAGKDEAAVLQALEVSQGTYLRWRNQYGGMKAEEATEAAGGREPSVEGDCGGPGLGYSDAAASHGGKLVSPSRKRTAVRDLRQEFGVSERRACEVLGLPRSSQRYVSSPRDDEAGLARRMRELAALRPRFGYRRLDRLLRSEDWRASDTRVYRLWRRKGLQVS